MKLHSTFFTITGILGMLGSALTSGVFGFVAWVHRSYIGASLLFLVTALLILLLTRMSVLSDDDFSQRKITRTSIMGGPMRAICIFKRNGRWRWSAIGWEKIADVRSWVETHDGNDQV